MGSKESLTLQGGGEAVVCGADPAEQIRRRLQQLMKYLQIRDINCSNALKPMYYLNCGAKIATIFIGDYNAYRLQIVRETMV
ncbi:MAG: hypothetical protein HFF69_11855 [Oscillospiraceae bacterium]|jgi:hypothetical protein|nr:hypothetical protein [Oscillospiraceae bacterium]